MRATLVLNGLKELHCNFIFVPVDKATNNLALTCKRLQKLVNKKELGFNSGNIKKMVIMKK